MLNAIIWLALVINSTVMAPHAPLTLIASQVLALIRSANHAKMLDVMALLAHRIVIVPLIHVLLVNVVLVITLNQEVIAVVLLVLLRINAFQQPAMKVNVLCVPQQAPPPNVIMLNVPKTVIVSVILATLVPVQCVTITPKQETISFVITNLAVVTLIVPPKLVLMPPVLVATTTKVVTNIAMAQLVPLMVNASQILVLLENVHLVITWPQLVPINSVITPNVPKILIVFLELVLTKLVLSAQTQLDVTHKAVFLVLNAPPQHVKIKCVQVAIISNKAHTVITPNVLLQVIVYQLLVMMACVHNALVLQALQMFVMEDHAHKTLIV